MLSKLSLLLIKFYQKKLSNHFGGHCVFEPSCSEYAKISIQANGFFYGWFQSIRRILKCKQPNGGFDYPVIRKKYKQNKNSK